MKRTGGGMMRRKDRGNRGARRRRVGRRGGPFVLPRRRRVRKLQCVGLGDGHVGGTGADLGRAVIENPFDRPDHGFSSRDWSLATRTHATGTRGTGLFMPRRLIAFRPRHPRRSPLHHHPTLLQRRPHPRLAFRGPVQSPLSPRLPVSTGLVLHIDPSSLGLALGAIQGSLDSRQEIEVMVDALRRRQIGALHIARRVTDSAALGPFLMPRRARQRACSCGAPRAAILWRGSVAADAELMRGSIL